MIYDTMDPALIKELLEGHEDIITKAAKKDEEIFKNATCPNCGSGECKKAIPAPKVVYGLGGEINVMNSPFRSNSPIIQGHAVCCICGTEFDPRTGIILKSNAPVILEPHSDPHQL
jgi:rubredoxin